MILIIILASVSAIFTWYALRTANPENEILQSYYSILIFPPLFCLLFLFMRKAVKT